MAFGKPGRPPEDRLARQRAIYEAVAPMILARGVSQISMRDAAHASCLSVGGLYHYFPTKRAMVLFPFQPDEIERGCQDFWARFGHLAEHDQERYVTSFLEYLEYLIFDYYRPALHAALELGSSVVWTVLDRTLTVALDQFAADLQHLEPGIPAASLNELARTLRREVFAAMFDTTMSPDELRKVVLALIAGYSAVAA